jgi:hypothetical protein
VCSSNCYGNVGVVRECAGGEEGDSNWQSLWSAAVKSAHLCSQPAAAAA